MSSTRNTLPSTTRKIAMNVLNGTVADLFDLCARIQQAHYNLYGQSFIGLHKHPEALASTVEENDVAVDRNKVLGGVFKDALRETVKPSRLKKNEEPTSKSGQRDAIRELADVHAACGDQEITDNKRVTAADDFGTADLLTDDQQLGIIEPHRGWGLGARFHGLRHDWERRPATRNQLRRTAHA